MQTHSVTPNTCGLKAGLRTALFILSGRRHATWRLLRKRCIPAKLLILLGSGLAKPWNIAPSRLWLADLLSARDYEAGWKSHRPRSDAEEQVW